MNRIIKLTAFIAFLLLTACGQKELDPVDYVNTFIGTDAHGHTFPGAVVPFGMVQLSPDNGTPGWDWCSGYNYSDSVIVGFSHKHLSGTGIGDLYDIQFMPGTGAYRFDSTGKPLLKSKFSHKSEKAGPGFYTVMLDKSGTVAELTATKRCGLQRYTFGASDSSFIALNLGFALNLDRTKEAFIKILNDTTIVGYRFSSGWARDQKVFFAARFSKPFFSSLIGSGDTLDAKAAKKSGKKITGVFYYPTVANERILVKTGISSVSIENAILNLKSEIPGWDFAGITASAEKMWRERLSTVEVKSENEAFLTTFYTSLYHSMIAPELFSDVNGQYRGADGEVHKTDGFEYYTVFSLGDTFRAAHPLYTIIAPELIDDFVNSMMVFSEQHGKLPVWALESNETGTMIGYHSIPVITDAYFKGLTDIPGEQIFDAFKKSAMADEEGLSEFREYGYIPADLENQSVSKNLEYAYDDWCIAKLAESLGKTEEAEYFSKRAQSYKKVFDSETKFMRGKFADGSWRKNFSPKYSSHEIHDYTEGNAWQYTWFVPHDVNGLIELMGGREKFTAKLDSLFTIDSIIEGEKASADISGLIGQYAHGNEPGHHTPYLFNFSGAAWKTQFYVRKIMNELYSAKPDGLCGNEDCGQMSAWYVFSALGFYPVNPADGKYYFGSPMFE